MEKKKIKTAGIVFGLFTGLLLLGVLMILGSGASPATAKTLLSGAAPVAVDDFYATEMDITLVVPIKNTTMPFSVLYNDSDAEVDPLTAVLVTGPTSGTLTLKSDGNFTYVPQTGFVGTVTFTYYAYDGTSPSNTATVTIDILDDTGTSCMADLCPKVGCSANDVTVSIVEIYAVDNYCTHIGDTGTYQFVLEFLAGANTRYDPTAFIALDGVNAENGTCASIYFNPPLMAETDPLPNYSLDLWGPPFWDFEDSPDLGDQCGDIHQGQYTYLITEPIDVECTAGLVDGFIDVGLSWDNQVDNNCPFPGVNGGCPGTSAKCRIESVPFEVSLNPVDLSIEKVASEFYDAPGTVDPYPGGNTIEPGEVFKYSLTVTNNSAHVSHGYQIFDDLPIWLKFDHEDLTDPLPDIWDYYEDDGISEDGLWGDNTREFCAKPTGSGCEGYGDIIYMNDRTNLLPGESRTYSFWVMFWPSVDYTEYCGDNPLDPRCLDEGVNPEFIDNEACVLGSDREDPILTETNSYDNCDAIAVPTEVTISSFSATSFKNYILVNWETSNEIDNLGFNLYRSTSVDGERIKLNTEIIPSTYPGSPEGSVYSFTDTLGSKTGIRPNKVYYYWLEAVSISGDTEIFGPVSATLITVKTRGR